MSLDSYVSAKEKQNYAIELSDCDDPEAIKSSRSFRKRKSDDIYLDSVCKKTNVGTSGGRSIMDKSNDNSNDDLEELQSNFENENLGI